MPMPKLRVHATIMGRNTVDAYECVELVSSPAVVHARLSRAR
jgi:hypothetical protein